MDSKISPDVLLKIAYDLFISTPKSKNDAGIDPNMPLSDRINQRADDFAKFYLRLRDKLGVDKQ